MPFSFVTRRFFRTAVQNVAAKIILKKQEIFAESTFHQFWFRAWLTYTVPFRFPGLAKVLLITRELSSLSADFVRSNQTCLKFLLINFIWNMHVTSEHVVGHHTLCRRAFICFIPASVQFWVLIWWSWLPWPCNPHHAQGHRAFLAPISWSFVLTQQQNCKSSKHIWLFARLVLHLLFVFIGHKEKERAFTSTLVYCRQDVHGELSLPARLCVDTTRLDSPWSSLTRDS